MIRSRYMFACLTAGLAGAVAAYAAPTVVSQRDKTFHPDELTEAAGQTVHINNDDGVPHNILVTDEAGDTRNFGVQKPGEAADVLLSKVGEYTVHCGIHPKMKLLIHAN